MDHTFINGYCNCQTTCANNFVKSTSIIHAHTFIMVMKLLFLSKLWWITQVMVFCCHLTEHTCTCTLPWPCTVLDIRFYLCSYDSFWLRWTLGYRCRAYVHLLDIKIQKIKGDHIWPPSTLAAGNLTPKLTKADQGMLQLSKSVCVVLVGVTLVLVLVYKWQM